MENVTKLTDLTPVTTAIYKRMARKTPREVLKYIQELLLEADCSESYSSPVYYDRAYSIVSECQDLLLKDLIMKDIKAHKYVEKIVSKGKFWKGERK